MSGSTVAVRIPGGELELRLPLPGLYNVYNALAAVAAALELGIEPERIAGSLAAMRGAFGRVETVAVEAKSVSILLIKNPAGANEVLRTLGLEAERVEARPLDRPQRPDRRRPRRLLGLGRRLRAAGGRRAAGDLRRHAGAGDGAAAEVRGVAGGRDRGRGRRSSGRWTGRLPRLPGGSSPCLRIRLSWNCTRCSPLGG